MNPNSCFVARTQRALLCLLLEVVLLLLPNSLRAETVPLKRMVELALQHATAAGLALADEQLAAANYRELRDDFIPQVSTGAGLGWTYGFPLSLEGAAPALFNLNAQSPLYHFELHDFLGAAHADAAASSLRRKDQRSQIIQDTVLSYVELQKWEQRLVRLEQSESEARTMQSAVAQRVRQGVDSELEGTKARLSVARIHLRIAEAQGAAAVLREHLAKLTGLPAHGIETEDSIPSPPQLTPEDNAPTGPTPADSNPAVQAALEHARAQYLRAQGERKAWMPSIDLAAQYAVLSRFNHYEDYFQPGSFKRNNATIGAVIRFSFLNAPQRARAAEAEAEALKAQKQAEAARNQASEETLRLQRSVAQMQAAREVAELEFEIAQRSIDAVATRMNAGNANLHDLDDARSQASERFIALQDVTFELERSQIALLRSTGDLEKWALGPN
jgi:outer membrane protein TolC